MHIKLKKLHKQVIVLTGATSGIGLSTARLAARSGATLVLVARNEAALQQLTKELQGQGVRACYVVADMGKEEEVARIADTAIQEFGGFDTWINIAGVGIFGKLEDVPVADMRRLFDTNFWGVVYGSRVAVQHLKSRGGALINVGSEVSVRAIPLQGMYSASKYAVQGFTDALRAELEEEKAPVSVTLVKPAAIDTPFIGHARNYLKVEPRLPPPIYAPDIVADVLLRAARHPLREVYVGGAAKLADMGAHYLPRLLDQGMQLLYPAQKTGRPAQAHAPDNLYTAGKDMQERGVQEGTTRETSLYTQLAIRPTVSRALLLGTGLALAALWRARRP